MPQLELATYSSQIFWLLVTFGLLYVLMARMAIPSVSSVLQGRKERISGDLDHAEELSEEARKTEEAYLRALEEVRTEASQVTSEALAQARKDAEKRHAELDKTLSARMKQAEDSIDNAREAALDEMRDVTAELASEMTKALTGKKVKAADAKKVVGNVLKSAA